MKQCYLIQNSLTGHTWSFRSTWWIIYQDRDCNCGVVCLEDRMQQADAVRKY